MPRAGWWTGEPQAGSVTLHVTGTFLTTGPIAGIAATRTNVFVSLPTGVAKYTLGGTLVQSFANFGVDRFGALSTHDGIVYAADNLTDGSLHGIVRFDDNPDVVGTFLTSGPIAGVAADGVDVFTSLTTGVSEYTATGTFVRSFANSASTASAPSRSRPACPSRPAGRCCSPASA